MAITIILPKYFSATSAGNAVRVCKKILDAEEDITLDASNLVYADPLGITLLGAALHDAFSWNLRVRISGLGEDVGGYLQRMDVFHGVDFVKCEPVKKRRRNRGDSLVELTRVDEVSDVDETAHRLAVAIVGRFPGIDPDEPPDEMSGYTVFDRLVEPIQYSLCELLENALTHARRGSHGSAFVWVAGQYYRSSKIVRLGVTDNGCGFLASLKGHPELRRKRHLDAILTALKPRVSCNRDLGIHDDSVNQGVGLTTVMRIAKHTGGRAVILSGNALHDTDGRSGSTPAGSIWQGVAVALEFRRDQLARTNFRELLPLVEGIPRIPLRFE